MTSQDVFSSLPDPDAHAWYYEGVPLKRLFAWLIDAVLIGVLTFLAGIVTLTVAWWFFPLFFAVIGFLYRVLTIAGGSATWGMRAMGIELRNSYGARFTGGEAFAHTLAYTVSLMFMVTQAASIVLMIATPRGQGLHDLLIGSVAINSPGR